MATKIDEIKATNWQLSNVTIGEVAEGVDDIRQCLGIIFTTTKGSDPLRPLFGSDIFKFVDTPTSSASANISAEIIDAVGKWEKRIIINTLTYNIAGTKIEFELTGTLLESGEITQILFFIDRQKQITGSAIGRAFSNGFDFGFS